MRRGTSFVRGDSRVWEKTRSGHFPEEEIIALRNLDDKSGPRGLLQEENLGILKYMC